MRRPGGRCGGQEEGAGPGGRCGFMGKVRVHGKGAGANHPPFLSRSAGEEGGQGEGEGPTFPFCALFSCCCRVRSLKVTRSEKRQCIAVNTAPNKRV